MVSTQCHKINEISSKHPKTRFQEQHNTSASVTSFLNIKNIMRNSTGLWCSISMELSCTTYMIHDFAVLCFDARKTQILVYRRWLERTKKTFPDLLLSPTQQKIIYTEDFQLSRTDVVTFAKQGPGQGLDEVSHEDLKLVLEDDWTSTRRQKTRTSINVPVICQSYVQNQ